MAPNDFPLIEKDGKKHFTLIRNEDGDTEYQQFINEAKKMAEQYEVGDIVKLKKPHPCGSTEWEILRVGADFRLKCTGCGHQIMIARKLVEKNTKELKKGLK